MDLTVPQVFIGKILNQVHQLTRDQPILPTFVLLHSKLVVVVNKRGAYAVALT